MRFCCDRKFRAACAQSLALWQQATIEIMLAISLTIACSCYIYNGFILHAHPVRGESHNQRNATREVATISPQRTALPMYINKLHSPRKNVSSCSAICQWNFHSVMVETRPNLCKMHSYSSALIQIECKN